MPGDAVNRSTQNSNRIRYLLFAALGAVALAVGITWAFSLRWVNDDAFISFRYAKNFADGLGLVYNAGERVEGYTNFLWTVLIAAGMKLGIDPVVFSTALGILCYSFTLLIFISLSRVFQRESPLPFLIPLTALGLSLHRDFNVYATGGLETSFFTFLVALSFLFLVRGKSRNSLLMAGSVLSLIMMTRADGAVFLIGAAVFVFLSHRERVKSCLYLLAPVVLFFGPYWMWRYEYYGFPFPNTYYAKSAYLPYYSQGIKYIVLYWKTYYVFTLLPILILLALKKERSGGGILDGFRSFRTAEGFDSPIARTSLLATIYCCLWMLYVARTGGDFMFARFLVPITPFFYCLCEILLTRYFRKVPFLTLAFVLLLATFLRFDQYTRLPQRDGITDEWQYYPRAYHERAQKTGTVLRKYVHELPIKIAFGGMMAQVIYYAEPPVAIEGVTGLTDTLIAHQQIFSRGRPGHEKAVPTDYLIRRKVNFLAWIDNAPFDKDRVNQISFDGIQLLILVYENGVMEQLTHFPEVQFVRAPQFIDSCIAGLDTLPRNQVVTGYAFLKTYYFDPNDDRTREQMFLSHMRGVSVESAR